MRTYYKLHTELNLNITVTDKDFSFNLDTKNLQTKWAIKTEVRDAEGDFWDKASNALNNFVSPDPPESVHKKRQEWMSGLKPNISFNSVGLGFFLTTNLLNPGAKVIKLDDKILRIPRDIVLVGDVVQGTDLAKSS